MRVAAAKERKGRLVLVVEDEDDMRTLMHELLDLAGYDVELAADGQEGIERLQAKGFDLVLLDLAMPRVDGWGVLAWLRGHSEPPPVIVLTGVGNVETLARCLDEGAALAFAKPLAFGELLEACETLTTPRARKTSDAVAPPGRG